MDEFSFRIYNEYCRALFEDVTSLSGENVRIAQAYHFHAFGDIGFLFLDTKVHPIFHHRKRESQDQYQLGSKQWADLEYALSEEGYLSSCKALMVCMPEPLAQISDSGWYWSSQKDKQALVGSWNTPAASIEASQLLERLFHWKSQKDNRREVV